MTNQYLLLFISPSIPFPFCFEKTFYFVAADIIFFFSSQRTLKSPVWGKLRMVNGEMFSKNQTIYLNTHDEMEKTPLINGDMLKSQLNISFSTT